MIPIIVLAVVAIFSGTDDRVKTAVMVEPSIEQCRADKATLDAALKPTPKSPTTRLTAAPSPCHPLRRSSSVYTVLAFLAGVVSTLVMVGIVCTAVWHQIAKRFWNR